MRAGNRAAHPAIDPAVSVSDLDPALRGQLKSLDAEVANAVAGHLIMTAELLEDEPALALEHARAARDLGARVGAVREAVGIAAYRAGEWAEARTELRTARRITGDPQHLALLGDCERALGKPELAIRLLDDPDVARLDPAQRAELIIVVASARSDMGHPDAGLLVLQREGAHWLDRARPSEAALRVWFVYADLLAAVGRKDDAVEWFRAVLRRDPDDESGVRDRMRELDLPIG